MRSVWLRCGLGRYKWVFYFLQKIDRNVLLNDINQKTSLSNMSNKVEEITKFAKRVLLNISCLECYEHTRYGDYESHEDGADSLKRLLEQNDYSIDKIIDKKTQTFFKKWNAEAGQPVKGESDNSEIEDLFDIFVNSYDFREIACLSHIDRMRFVDEFVQIMEL